MGRKDHTFALALIASLLLHAAIALVVADEAARRLSIAPSAAASAQSIAYIATSTPPPPQKLDALFGDPRGIGDAANARSGATPMAGRDGGQTQAFLSRDPVGAGAIFKEPSMSVLPTGSAAAVSAPAVPPTPPPSRPLFGLGERTARWSVPHVTRIAPTALPASGADLAATPGVPLPAADPAVMSESESDPFTKNAALAVEFRDGRVEARLGRKVKTIRPHLSLASQFDLMGMQFPRMIVRVHVHTDGSVRRVDIVKSTGSATADQEVKVALYQWWFEPTKQEVVEFPITWR